MGRQAMGDGRATGDGRALDMKRTINTKVGPGHGLDKTWTNVGSLSKFCPVIHCVGAEFVHNLSSNLVPKCVQFLTKLCQTGP